MSFLKSIVRVIERLLKFLSAYYIMALWVDM